MLLGAGIVGAAAYVHVTLEPSGSTFGICAAAIVASVVIGGALTRGKAVTGANRRGG